MQKKLFQKFASYENLFQALQYVVDDRKDDFVQDVIRNQDFVVKVKEHLKAIEYQLKNDSFSPSAPLFIDIPKQRLSVRPGSIVSIQDRIVGYALVTVLAPIMDRLLPDNVYSYRLKKGDRSKQLLEDRQFLKRKFPILKFEERQEIDDFEEWYVQWPEFVKASKYFLEVKKYKYLVQTDISAYFENINHDILISIISEHVGDQRLLAVLRSLLAKWTWPNGYGVQTNRGIPQGNDISSFFGNIYLLPLDQYLRKQRRGGRVDYVRYVDDVWVFTRTREEARRIHFGINRALRDLCLNMQTAKSKIYEESEMHKVFDDRVDKINETIEAIEKLPETSRSHFKSKDASLLHEKVARIYSLISRKSQLSDKKDLRLFKRILTAFRLLKSGRAVVQCFRELENNPPITQKVFGYLKTFPRGPKIGERLRDFIDSEANIFAWQEGILISLWRFRSVTVPSLHKDLAKRIKNSRNHWFVRAEAILTYVAFSSDSKQLEFLRPIYDKNAHPFIKRALIFSTTLANQQIRKQFFQMVLKEGDPGLTRFVQYLQELSTQEDLGAQEIKAFQDRTSSGDPTFLIHNWFKLFYLVENPSPRIKKSLSKLIDNFSHLHMPDWLRKKNGQLASLLKV